MHTSIRFSLPPSSLRLGVIEADGVTVGPSPREYLAHIEQDIAPVLEPSFTYPDHVRKGIRSLLRHFGFHPSGRNRPASEFLVKDLQGRGCFHAINNLVDMNNHLSLVSHLPISILDVDKTEEALVIRLGNEGESYIFNPEGQELALKHLLTICGGPDGRTAFGSPVKDSQATKISAATTRAVAVIYTSASITPVEELESLLARFQDVLVRYAGARRVEYAVLDSPQ